MNQMVLEEMKTVAVAIRMTRVRQDVTQEELAEYANISPQFLCRLENAKKTASLETYIKIADALHMELSDLFRKDKSVSLSGREKLVQKIMICSDFEFRVCDEAVEGILSAMRK
jgi:DNA-binding XRE family transcriptional regulator